MRFAQLLSLMLLPLLTGALYAEEICLYTDQSGRIVQVNGRRSVPSEFRTQAQCVEVHARGDRLADPQDISLKGLIREDQMNSNLGPVQLRWPRAAELLFGRTPQRATLEAAQAVSRALRQASFPPAIQNLRIGWNIVFLGGELSAEQIPSYLISNCHPGWMTPPANIYIVSERVAGGCGGMQAAHKVADSQLAQVLIHEIGHAVEYALLDNRPGRDAARAEGFATWFESYASDFSSVIPRGQAKRSIFSMLGVISLAQLSAFSGGPSDYALASLPFHAIVDRRGVKGLASVYETMSAKRVSFLQAVQLTVGWDPNKLEDEMRKAAG